MKRLSIIPLAVLAVAPLTRVTAQEPPPVKVGDRVRVSHDCTYRGTRKRCQEDKGSLARLTGDSLVLTIDNRETSLAVSLASVTRLQLSRGRKSKIVTGAAVGLLVGTGATAAFLAGFCSDPDALCESDEVFRAFSIIGLLPTALGTLIGLAVRVERWESLPLDQLRVSVVPQRDGRFGLGLSVRF